MPWGTTIPTCGARPSPPCLARVIGSTSAGTASTATATGWSTAMTPIVARRKDSMAALPVTFDKSGTDNTVSCRTSQGMTTVTCRTCGTTMQQIPRPYNPWGKDVRDPVVVWQCPSCGHLEQEHTER